MKLRITKAEYDALSETSQGLYEASGEGYRLVIDDYDHDEIDRLRTTNQTLLDEKKKVDLQAKEAKRLADQGKKDAGDFESLYQSSEAKRLELEEEIKENKEAKKKQEVSSAAQTLASELSSGKNIPLMKRVIMDFLDYVGDKVVVTKDGKPTVSTLKDLKATLINCGDYDSLIDANLGGGGDTDPKKRDGNKGENWEDYTATELSAIRKSDQARYDRLKKTRKTRS